MLFSKSKPKSDELLPPPPPFPSMELEENEISKKPVEAKTKPKDEFEDLFKEVESLGKKEKIAAKEIRLPKEKPQAKKLQVKLPKMKKEKINPVAKLHQKPSKKEVLQVKKPAKIAKGKRKIIPAKKQALKQAAIKAAKPKSLGFNDLGIGELQIPKTGEIKLEHEIEFPEEAPEQLKLDIDNVRNFPGDDLDFELQPKPREIREAENEIKSAIEKIRHNEKPSFFRRLFSRKENGREIQPYEKDDMSAVSNRISRARDSLMKFDLDEARENYVEAMRIYKRMNPEEQAKVYHEIKDLYYERKSAEQLKA